MDRQHNALEYLTMTTTLSVDSRMPSAMHHHSVLVLLAFVLRILLLPTTLSADPRKVLAIPRNSVLESLRIAHRTLSCPYLAFVMHPLVCVKIVRYAMEYLIRAQIGLLYPTLPSVVLLLVLAILLNLAME